MNGIQIDSYHSQKFCRFSKNESHRVIDQISEHKLLDHYYTSIVLKATKKTKNGY